MPWDISWLPHHHRNHHRMHRYCSIWLPLLSCLAFSIASSREGTETWCNLVFCIYSTQWGLFLYCLIFFCSSFFFWGLFPFPYFFILINLLSFLANIAMSSSSSFTSWLCYFLWIIDLRATPTFLPASWAFLLESSFCFTFISWVSREPTNPSKGNPFCYLTLW